MTDYKAPKGKYKIHWSLDGEKHERDATPEECEVLDKQTYKSLIVTTYPTVFAGGSYIRKGSRIIITCKSHAFTFPAGIIPKGPVKIAMNIMDDYMTAEFEVEGWVSGVASAPCKHEPTFKGTTLGLSVDVHGNEYPTSTSKCGHCGVTLQATWSAK